MRGIIGWNAALLVMGLGVGCSAGVGGSTGELYAVEPSFAETEGLFLDESLDSRPLTETQMVELYGELSPNAVPVEVEVLNHVAVAWLRTDDGIDSRTRADLVAAWRVEGVYEGATPIDGELHNIPGGPIYVPNDGLDFGDLPDFSTGTDLTGNAYIVIDFTNGLDTSIFTQPEIFNDFNNAHPGCA